MNTSTPEFAKLLADPKRHQGDAQRLLEEFTVLTKAHATPESMKGLFKLANDVFGENIAKFFILSNRSLGNMPPIMVAQTGQGVDEVERLLKRNLSGVYG